MKLGTLSPRLEKGRRNNEFHLHSGHFSRSFIIRGLGKGGEGVHN